MQEKTSLLQPPAEAEGLQRAQVLQELGISLTETSPALQALVDTVADQCQVPVALITLLDDERQWHKARHGFDIESIPVCDAFCQHTIRYAAVMQVPNARLDIRFSENPLVTTAPGVGAYAGAPIELASGVRVGSLCAIDVKPRSWSDNDRKLLQNLSLSAARILELEASEKRMSDMAIGLKAAVDRSRQFDVFFDGLQEGVVVQDENSNIIEANPNAADVLGLTLDQLLGRDSFDPNWRIFDETGAPLPPEMQPSNQALTTGKPVTNFIVGVELANGTQRWISINSQPYFRPDETRPYRTATTFIDITEKRERELELVRQSVALEKAAKQAEAANAAKTAFLANMSHELRTPLNGIVGLASVLNQTSLDDEQSEMVSLILTSGKALGQLLDDTMDLSRIEAGRLEISNEAFNVEQEMHAAVDVFRIAATNKGLDFDVRVEAGCCATAVGDAIRIRQIISNLVANAIKFTDKGGVTVRIRFSASPSDTDGCMLNVLVADSGIGFSGEQKERLFNRFQQADRSITRRFGGVGLGLSISQELAAAMGGRIRARSTPGKGSVFRLTVPLKASRSETAGSCCPAPAPMPEVNKLHVLIAEDHPTNQRMLSIILETAGCVATLANDGNKAVEAFATGTFDCVILDMHMPERDGLSAAAEIRKTVGGADVPIIMLTADTSGQGQNRAKAAGINLLLHKPVTAESLLTAMQQVMAAGQTGESS